MPNNELLLYKTYDHSVSKKPKLVVVFLHGIASDSSTFSHAISYLESLKSMSDVRLVTFDLLGSGKSLKSDELTYGFNDQLSALHNSIDKLQIADAPLILVGHSMGTLIATRYVSTYKNTVKRLILLSPPIYTEKDLDSPAFNAGMKVFQEAVSVKNRRVLEEKAFKNSISRIILNRQNYSVLAEIDLPTTLIYGNIDQFIASYNIPKLLKVNNNITAIKTEGRHGVSRDKYTKLSKLLEEELNALHI